MSEKLIEGNLSELSVKVLQDALLFWNIGLDEHDSKWNDLINNITGQSGHAQIIEPLKQKEFSPRHVLLAHIFMWPAIVKVFCESTPKEFPAKFLIEAMENYNEAVLCGGWMLSLSSTTHQRIIYDWIKDQPKVNEDLVWGDQVDANQVELKNYLKDIAFGTGVVQEIGVKSEKINDTNKFERTTTLTYSLEKGLSFENSANVTIVSINSEYEGVFVNALSSAVVVILRHYLVLEEMVNRVKLINPIAQQQYMHVWTNELSSIVYMLMGCKEVYRWSENCREMVAKTGIKIETIDHDLLANTVIDIVKKSSEVVRNQRPKDAVLQ